jgi:hypothetical protein
MWGSEVGWSGCYGMGRAGGAVLGREGCVVVGEGE